MKKIFTLFVVSFYLISIPFTCLADGNGTLGIIYDLIKCGLNYTSASQRLGQRFSPAGVPQPAGFVISGIPSCATIERAYLWAEGSGDGAAQTATVAGPSGTANFPMSISGSGPDKCWSYAGSYTYRADVTSIVTGNGTYNISGILTNPPNTSNDMDGATLMVIYSDPAATYQGRMVLADGAWVVGGGTASYNMGYSAVCGNTTNASAFIGIGDLQNIGGTATLNGTGAAFTWNWWNLISTSTTVASGQTTSNFTFTANGDCFNLALAGLYYQTTSCATCTPPAIALTPTSTATSCNTCNGTASVTAVAPAGPNTFTYSWAPSGGTGSTATGLCAGTYTVTVSNGCLTNTATVTVASSGGFTVNGSQTNVTCHGQCNGTASVTPVGGTSPFTYSWAPSGGNAATATNLCAGNYTCTVNDAAGCSGTKTFTITEPPLLVASISAVKTSVCYGQSTTINFAGTPNAIVTYNVGGPNQTITLSAVGTASISTGALIANATYTLVSAQLAPCSNAVTGSVTVVVNALPVFNVGMPSNNGPLCSGNTLNLFSATSPASSTYSWTGPAFGTPNTNQNPSIPAAPIGDAGTYTVTATDGNGCSVTGTTTVVINLTPAINIAGTANPTSCGGNQGSIIINGLTPNSNYTLFYSTPAAVTLPILSNAGGQYILSGLTAGTYSNIYVTQNGCTSNTVGPITLTDPAPPLILSSSTTIPTGCGGNQGTISLNGLLPNTSYLVNYFDGITNHTLTITSGATGTVVITGLTAGTYSNVTVSINSCTSPAAGPFVITDPSPPVIGGSSFTSPTSCGGNQGSITLTGLLTNTTYTVSYYNGVSTVSLPLTSDAFGQVLITGLPAGTYSNVTVTLNACTSAAVGPFVLTNPVAPVVTAGSNTPVCEGQALNLTANVIFNGNPVTPTSVNWTGPAFITPNLQQNPVVNNAVPAYSGVYTVTAIYAGCSSSPATTTVTVYPAPATPVMSSNSPVCSDSALMLAVNTIPGAVDYYWTGPNGLSVHQQNDTINNVQTINAGTYTLAVTSNNNCSLLTPATINVVVNQTPGTPLVTDAVYCQADVSTPLAATPSGNPGDVLIWYTTPSGGTGTLNAPVPSTTTPGTYVWYVSQQTGAGCEGLRVPQTVLVKQKPSTPIVFTAQHYCEGDSNVAALVAQGDSVQWYTVPVGGIGSFTAPTPVTNTPGTFTWYVTQTKDGCESDRLPVIITVGQKPPVPVTSPVTYCKGDVAVPLTATGQFALKWYNVPVGGVASQFAPVPATDTPSVTTWYVSQTLGSCESDRVPITVTVLYRPTAGIIDSRDEVCQGDTLMFSYIGDAHATTKYAWGWPAGSTVLNGQSAGPYIVRFEGMGTRIVSVVATDSICSSPKALDTITVKQTPEISISLRNNIVCTGDMAYLNISWVDMEIQNYKWDFGGGHLASGPTTASDVGPYYLQWDNQGHYVVTLNVDAKNGCSAEATDTVNVHEHPSAKINTTITGDVCSGQDIVLSADVNNSRYTYSWTPKEFFDYQFDSPVVTAHADKSQYITLKVTNEYGCESMDSIMINTKPCCELLLPTAFSPNGDSKNDLFRILNPGSHKLVSFRVFDRFGEVVFETADENSGWNGAHDGVAQEMGVYFYQVKYLCDGKEVLLKGDVTLIR